MSHESPGNSDLTETAAIVRAMLCPAMYPGRCGVVVHHETHISHVFLTERHAYKLKKPVQFPFLDYSTLQRRRVACDDELRLNRRLAPAVYLDVIPITRNSAGQIELAGGGEVVDYCVRMVRLPEDRMLDRLIRDGTATQRHIERVLDLLSPFYERAARGPEIDRYATAAAIEQNVRENLSTMSGSDDMLPQPMWSRVRGAQLQFLKLRGALFESRIRSGHVCEGHGDLRPEHICLSDGRAAIFDCVEFSLAFRAADRISELAFLAMECDFLGAPELGRALFSGYQSRSVDEFPDALASFYKSYRACVRSKVELLRAAQEQGEPARNSIARAVRYLQLASYYVAEFAGPMLFVMVGAAGTGKSTTAGRLADALGLEMIRTDVVRHEAAARHASDGPAPPQSPRGRGEGESGEGEGCAPPQSEPMYSPSFNALTYDLVFRGAEELLRESNSVVLDGTFRDSEARDRAVKLAQSAGADIHFIYCHCPASVAHERIADRLARGTDVSEARPQLHDVQQRELDAVDWTRLPVIHVDTDRPAADVTASILAALAARGSRHK